MDALETRVLVIDDEKSIRDSIGALLEDNKMQYLGIESGEKALEVLEKDQKFHVVLLDVWLKDMDGFEVLEKLFQKKLDIPIIMMTGHGNIEMAVQATKKGAYDFLEKPFSTERLILLIQHARKENALILENRHLKSNQGDLNLTIIGKSRQIQEVRDFIAAAALSDAKVSIYGENGTGKELVAKNIHALSARRKYPWVAVNSAAIPDELIESELFGHEKGSFTSAIKQTMGKFELANKGSLFLDEIGDMSLKTQAKILRVLQEGVFTRVGGTQDIQVDVRVIAATNKDLTKEIEKGNFREDLYYRIHILPVVIPPLRERQEDLELLIYQFMEQLKSIRSKVKSFDPATLEILKAYPWPGNIRELKNLVERLLILVQEPVILPRHLPYSYFKQKPADTPVNSQPNGSKDAACPTDNPLDLNSARKNFEENFIRKSLQQNLWNISKTAKALGLERSYLHKKMKLYKLSKDQEG